MPRKKPPRRRSYDTDLSDGQWALIEPLIPQAEPGGRPRKAATRELVDAILYFLRAGGSWRLLPHDLPPWQTVYYYLRRWQREGVERTFAWIMKNRRFARDYEQLTTVAETLIIIAACATLVRRWP